eukprot:2397662-Prymnesium_polylepis.1
MERCLRGASLCGASVFGLSWGGSNECVVCGRINGEPVCSVCVLVGAWRPRSLALQTARHELRHEKPNSACMNVTVQGVKFGETPNSGGGSRNHPWGLFVRLAALAAALRKEAKAYDEARKSSAALAPLHVRSRRRNRSK